ncbi:MAG: hypothetical protein OEY91_12625 [Nitrospirota bacterium]|nr:hypothetical protein [Nitrospirota bacterium]
MLTVAWPLRVVLRGSLNPAACKLAELVLRFVEWLRQCAPSLRSQLHCSALPPGQGNSHGSKGRWMPTCQRLQGHAQRLLGMTRGEKF